MLTSDARPLAGPEIGSALGQAIKAGSSAAVVRPAPQYGFNELTNLQLANHVRHMRATLRTGLRIGWDEDIMAPLRARFRAVLAERYRRKQWFRPGRLPG
jgi:hypothetical protein